jgi:hypothetical protein
MPALAILMKKSLNRKISFYVLWAGLGTVSTRPADGSHSIFFFAFHGWPSKKSNIPSGLRKVPTGKEIGI